MSNPYFWVVAIAAVVAIGFGKGGFAGLGTIGVPLLALVISPVQAAAIILPILIVQDLVTIGIFWRKWNLRIVRLLSAGALVGVFGGYLFAATVPIAAIEFVLGVISLVFGAQRLWIERPGQNVTAVTFPRWAGILAGVASGFTSQVAHAGGPPAQVYLMPQRLERDVFLGTMALFFTILNWMKVPAYMALGQLTPSNLMLAAALLPVAIVSTWAGAYFARAVHGRILYYAIYALMIALGLKLMWDGAAGLWF